MKTKKSIMGAVISVFVVVLVIAIMAGLTFLFIIGLQNSVVSSTQVPFTTVNESGWINQTPYTFANAGKSGFNAPSVVLVNNQTNQVIVTSSNYTVGNNFIVGVVGTGYNWTSVNITYTYNAVSPYQQTAYNGVNTTAAAGYSIIGYLPLIFLALIFGAILTLVLKIILPFINLGQAAGGGEY